LARYGITDSSLLCLDSKPGTLKAGQADGLQPRTLEVLQSLGIASEIISEGCHMEEVAFWNPVSTKSDASKTGIERTEFVPDVNVPARYPFEVTIHQGRIERILQDDLYRYASADVLRRSHRFIDYVVDDSHSDYPVLVNYEYDDVDGTTKKSSVRTKYLVGADGARSLVRKCMGLELQGETTDHIWGVCDFVADTDFPDIRKRSAVHSDAGSVMVIPREQISTGEYLTRLYVQVPGEVDADSASGTDKKSADKKSADKQRRGAVTLEYIFQQAKAVFAPYKIEIKEGTVPDWWAAYQIGQRMTPKFSARTPDGLDRVFIVGDGESRYVYWMPKLTWRSMPSSQPKSRTGKVFGLHPYHPPTDNILGHERIHDGLVQPSLETRPQHQRPHTARPPRRSRPDPGNL
jgi:phenol 2-monooxygenase